MGGTLRIILILVAVSIVHGQINNIKPLIEMCYNDLAIPGIIIANNRPPANLNIFLELLRRFEDANSGISTREFSTLIVQRLRQNGIVSTGRATNLSIAIPFVPRGLDAGKGTLVSQNYLTNSSQTLNWGDINQLELCSFHYMISNSLNKTIRGDETTSCVRSARFQVRAKRDTKESDDDGDIEQVEHLGSRISNFLNKDGSECPLELGVVYTPHGTVKMGQVLAGLAAAENQENHDGLDNRYAVTIVGDLAHVGLAQAGQSEYVIGASGGWNNTINHKYFFLERKNNLELTNQDIRGSIDGLMLALKLDAINRRYSDIKLSQIIDMYYSPMQRGVFDPSFRACNRNILYTEYVDTRNLPEKIDKIIRPLNELAFYSATVLSSGYSDIPTETVNSFINYLPNIKDLDCPTNVALSESTATDLLIFLDPSWNYNTVQLILSYILNNIDVSKYASRYTLFSGADGFNITNSTRYLLDFYKNYTLDLHTKLTGQFDYLKVYELMESIARSKLDNNTHAGGESTVVLLIPRSPPNNDQTTFLEQRKEIIKQWLPDLNIIVLGQRSSAEYSSILLNPNKDFVSLTETTSETELRDIGEKVVERIKSIPRAVINPSCGSGFTGSENTFSLTQYIDLNSFNYYKISPNYFFKGGKLKVAGASYGSFTLCVSRDESKPNNETSDCRTIQIDTYESDLGSLCGGSFSDCSPIYMSIYGNSTQFKCRDYMCRFPDSIKAIITLENVNCVSGAYGIISNCFLLIALIFLSILYK